MDVILFGATGMVGQGVLRECLLDPGVGRVLSIGRTPSGAPAPSPAPQKLRQLIRPNLFDYSDIEADLTGYDACFFTLGVSSAGMSEADYRRITYDLTLAAATTLAKLNPSMTFVYVSGEGTDSTEKGRTMWARVKGATENALMRLPFRGAYMFRPGFIQPMHGAVSKTRSYRVFYKIFGPVIPLLRRIAPRWVTTTEQIGRAMLRVARDGAPSQILNTAAINRL